MKDKTSMHARVRLKDVLKATFLQLGALLGHAAALSMVFLQILWPVLEARAADGIVIDPTAPRGQRPSLDRSNTGRTVVNITAPKAGVSHNRYTSFSVTRGVIFNNSTRDGQSVTGGFVRANPNLSQSGPAHLIVNEVRGQKSSYLRGDIEVFGRRADLVIANENGVICDSCRFVNVGRATLSSGQPRLLTQGRVQLDIRRGGVGVWKGGLETKGAITLAGRHVVINGRISVDDVLEITAGAHTYELGKGVVAPLIGGRRDAPHAIDVYDEGRLNAREIIIRGAEPGLGIRLDGYLSATDRVAIVSTDGLTLNSLRSGGNVDLKAIGGIVQRGTLEAAGDVTVASETYALLDGGLVQAGGRVSFETRDRLDLAGTVSANTITVSAQGRMYNLGTLLSGTTVSLKGAGIINGQPLNTLTVAPALPIDMPRYRPWLEDYLHTTPDGWLAPYYRDLMTREGGAHLLRGDRSGKAGDIEGQTIEIAAREEDVINRGGHIVARKGLRIAAARDLFSGDEKAGGSGCAGDGLAACMLAAGLSADESGRPGFLNAGQGLSLKADRDIVIDGYSIGGGAFTAKAGGNLVLHNDDASSTPLQLSAVELQAREGRIDFVRDVTAEEGITMVAGGDLRHGRLTAGADIGLAAKGRIEGAGAVAGGALTIATDGDITETGALQAGRALMVESSGGAVHVQDRVESGADAVLQAGGDLVADGTRMAAAGDLTVVAGGSVFLRSQATGARETILTYNGQPHGLETWREERRDAVRRADLNAGGLLVIDAGEDILLRATKFSATGDLSLSAGGDISGEPITQTFEATERVRRWQRLASTSGTSEDWTFREEEQTTSGRRTLKTELHGRTVSLQAGGALRLDGLEVSARETFLVAESGDLSLTGLDSLDHAGDVILRTPETLTLHADHLAADRVDFGTPKAFDFAGAIDFGARQLALSGLAFFTNRGSIRAASVRVAAERIDGGGDWQTPGILSLQATAGGIALGTAEAEGMQLRADRGSITATGLLDAGAADLVIDAGTEVSLAGLTARDASVLARDGTIALKSGAPYEVSGSLLLNASAALRLNGGLILRSGGAMTLHAGGDLTLAGLLDGETFTPTRLTAGGDLYLSAGGSITNTGGIVEAGGHLSAVAGEDIVNTAQKRVFKLDNGLEGFAYEPARLVAAGGLMLYAGHDIRNVGSEISGDAFVHLTALNDVFNTGIAEKYVSEDYYRKEKKRKWYGKKTIKVWRRYHETAVLVPATIRSASGEITIKADRDFVQEGGVVEARGALSVDAGRDVKLLSQFVALTHIDFYKKNSSWAGLVSLSKLRDDEHWTTVETLASELKGETIDLRAGRDLEAKGGVLLAQGDITLRIAGNIKIDPLTYETHYTHDYSRSGFLKLTKKKRNVSRDETHVDDTALKTDQSLTLRSETGNVTIKAANLEAGRDIAIEAPQGKIALLAATTRDFEREVTYSRNPVWWKRRDKGHEIEEAILTRLQAGGSIRIRAGEGVVVDFRVKPGETPVEALLRLIELPQFAWMRDLVGRNGVELRPVQEVARHWDYKAEGLTPGAAAFIMLAVGLATQGLGNSLGTALAGGMGLAETTAGTMLQQAVAAGVQYMSGRAAVALVNNKGDISKALKELTSSDALKSLATTLFTAGLTAGMDAGMFANLGLNLGPGGSGEGVLGSIVADLPRQVAESTLRAAISTVIEGGRFDKTLLNSLRAVGVNQVLGAVQGVIGDLTDGAGGPDLPVMNMIAHALAGGLASKAMGGTFEAGAAAALSSAMAANAGLFSGLDPRTLDAVSQLIGGAAALLAGGDATDVTQGATIARSAAFNNYLTHEEIKELARRLKSCKEKDKKCRLNISLEYLELSKENSKALYSCGIDNVCVLKHIYLINEAYNDLDKYLSDIDIDPWVRKNLIMYQNADTMHALEAYFYNLHLQKACPSLDTSCVEREKTKDRAKKIGEIIIDFTPFIGDIKAFYEAGKSGDPLDWVAAIIGIVPAAGDAAAKELKLLRLAKAGKLKGLSRAEFDKLPEVAHLSKAERDQAYFRYVLAKGGDLPLKTSRFNGITPRNADEERFLRTLRLAFSEKSVWNQVTRHRGNIIVQRSDIELSIQNLRNMKNGLAPMIKNNEGEWERVVLHHIGRKDGRLIEVLDSQNRYDRKGGPLHIPGPGGPVQRDLKRTYWKHRFNELVKSEKVDPKVLEKLNK